jgi:inner membrane protein
MPSPVAHSLAGAALYLAASPAGRLRVNWPTALTCVATACAADLDFLAGFAVGDWGRYHQGASHSLGVALALGFALAWLPLAGAGPWARRWGLLTACSVSHLALDLVTRDARAPYGVPLLWPLSDAYVYTGIELFPNMRRGSLDIALSAGNWHVLAIEVALLGPVVLAAGLHRWRRGQETRIRGFHG